VGNAPKTITIIFGESQDSLQQKIGRPLSVKNIESYNPIGIRKTVEYKEIIFTFDNDRLCRAEFQQTYKGGSVNIDGNAKYRLDEGLTIGDPSEKAKRIFTSYESMLRTKYGMREYKGIGKEPDEENPLVYSVEEEPDFDYAGVSAEKLPNRYAFSYTVRLTTGKIREIDKIDISIGKYESEYWYHLKYE